jgi:hypothetical protein
MLNESEHELSVDQTIANSSTGYLVFNGRPDNETAQPLTSLEDLENDIRAFTEGEALDALREAGFSECKSAKLERWQFPVNGVNDVVSIEVWVPQLG